MRYPSSQTHQPDPNLLSFHSDQIAVVCTPETGDSKLALTDGGVAQVACNHSHLEVVASSCHPQLQRLVWRVQKLPGCAINNG